MKDDPLAPRGEALGAAEVERFALMVVEDRKVMERVAGHADDVGHRKHGSACGDGLSGNRLEFLERRGDDDGRRRDNALKQGMAPIN